MSDRKFYYWQDGDLIFVCEYEKLNGSWWKIPLSERKLKDCGSEKEAKEQLEKIRGEMNSF